MIIPSFAVGRLEAVAEDVASAGEGVGDVLLSRTSVISTITFQVEVTINYAGRGVGNWGSGGFGDAYGVGDDVRLVGRLG